MDIWNQVESVTQGDDVFVRLKDSRTKAFPDVCTKPPATTCHRVRGPARPAVRRARGEFMVPKEFQLLTIAF